MLGIALRIGVGHETAHCGLDSEVKITYPGTGVPTNRTDWSRWIRQDGTAAIVSDHVGVVVVIAEAIEAPTLVRVRDYHQVLGIRRIACRVLQDDVAGVRLGSLVWGVGLAAVEGVDGVELVAPEEPRLEVVLGLEQGQLVGQADGGDVGVGVAAEATLAGVGVERVLRERGVGLEVIRTETSRRSK